MQGGLSANFKYLIGCSRKYFASILRMPRLIGENWVLDSSSNFIFWLVDPRKFLYSAPISFCVMTAFTLFLTVGSFSRNDC